MSETDGAKEYFDKLKIAEKFCGGDTALAKKLLSGEFQDTGVIKGRFNEKEKEFSGLFLLFINRITFSLLAQTCLVTPSMSVNLIKPFDDWYSFYSRLVKEKESGAFDTDRTNTLRDSIRAELDKKSVNSLFNMMEDNEIQLITDKFVSIICKALETEEINVLLDFEYTTSIMLNEKLGLKP